MAYLLKMDLYMAMLVIHMIYLIKNSDFPVRYVSLPEGKPPFSHGFPMDFPLKPPGSTAGLNDPQGPSGPSSIVAPDRR